MSFTEPRRTNEKQMKMASRKEDIRPITQKVVGNMFWEPYTEWGLTVIMAGSCGLPFLLSFQEHSIM